MSLDNVVNQLASAALNEADKSGDSCCGCHKPRGGVTRHSQNAEPPILAEGRIVVQQVQDADQLRTAVLQLQFLL